MKNNHNLLLNEIVSKIVTLDMKSNQIKIYVQKYNDFNLLLKLNDELLNSNSDCEITFYCNEINKKINSASDIIKIESIDVDNIANFSFDYIISDSSFNENEENLKDLLNYNYHKLILTVSSTYFDENIKFLQSLRHHNYIKSIISLPIYKNNSNLVILSFDSSKTNDKILLIDESDAINPKTMNDWTFITEDLSKKILDSYVKFKEYDNGLILSISKIIHKKSIFGDDFEKYIKKDSNKDLAKKRVVPNKIADDVLSSKNKNPNFSLKSLNYSKKRQDPENLLYKNNKKIFDEDVKFKTLGEIANLKQINKKNQKDRLLITTCRNCTSHLVFNNFDVDEFIDDEIYIEVNVISKDIMSEYLKVYLNSTNGLNEIFYFAKGKYITAEEIQHVKVPVPPKNIQMEIVKASQEANDFFKSIDLLKKEYQANILDYKTILESIDEFKGDIAFDEDGGSITKLPRNWQHVYNGLIWPLAISYLSATRGTSETLEKLKRYLSLFEFVAAFNFIVLLSGLPENVYKQFKNRIWDFNRLYLYEEMTFGNWAVLTSRISKVYKYNDFTSNFDEKLFDLISSQSIIDILFKTKDYRDTDAHDAPINKIEAQKIIDELDVYLENIFNILDVYSNYKLIYITGAMENIDGKLKHEVILLNGPCAQPIYDGIIVDKVLNKDALYLYDPKNNKTLKINDKFMKFVPMDENKKHWSLFIYYKNKEIDDNKAEAYYKCFQSREDDIIESINSFKKDII